LLTKDKGGVVRVTLLSVRSKVKLDAKIFIFIHDLAW